MKGPSRGLVTVAVIAAAVTVTLLGISGSLSVAVSDHRAVLTVGFNAAVVVAFAVVGAVVAGARPGNRVGWLMLAAGATWALGSAAVDLSFHGIVTAPGSVPAASAFAVAGSAVRSVGWYLVTLAVPAYFPDGRLAEPRVRWLKPVLIVIVMASVLDATTDKQADLSGYGAWRNPIAPPRPWDVISGIGLLGHVPLSLVAVVGIIIGLRARWRRGDALARQQLLLFFAAVALPVLAVPLSFGVASVGDWVFGAAALPLPFAIGFAVLARGLYDLRTAANRTLVWVTLSLVIAGLYAVVIAGVGSRIDAGGTGWLAWAAAAVVAVTFAPLRDLLQRGINRLTFGRWDEPYDVLAGLGQQLEASANVHRLLVEVVNELHGLGLGDVAICDAHGRVLAGDPTAREGRVNQSLAAFGQPVGTLHYRAPDPPLRARDRRLLDDLAGHLGGVLHAHQLTLDLQRALERQVLSREEERRRLRRDLHDGLGPALAGHLLRLDLVAAKVGRTSPAAQEIDELREELRGTVTEVRRVVEGLRPPALDELGLAGALTQVLQRLAAGNVVQVDLHVGDLPQLSAAAEVAAFRIVTEAVTNVIRHANARTCRVSIDASDGVLRTTITDDGTGISDAAASSGNGLQTMRERADELRGRLRVSSAFGTTVTAELPLFPTGRQAAIAPAGSGGP